MHEASPAGGASALVFAQNMCLCSQGLVMHNPQKGWNMYLVLISVQDFGCLAEACTNMHKAKLGKMCAEKVSHPGTSASYREGPVILGCVSS